MTVVLRSLQKFLPLLLGSSYLSLLFVLLQQSDRPEVSGVTTLFVFALLYRWWDTERDFQKLYWNGGAIAIAFFISLGLILRGWYYYEDEAFLRLLPLLSLGSWGLLCYGWQSFQKLAEGFLLFGFLAFPWEIVYVLVDLSLLTTKLAHLLLHIFGFQSERIGTLLRLGAGSIEVYHGCSGLKMMLQLLGFALIYMVLNPSSLQRNVALILEAITIGFLLNGLRVAMMAILVSLGDEAAFDYWHLGTGSLIFSVIGLGILGLLGWQIQRWQND